ncbi:MAG: hypothetical protein QOI42_1788 [Frankiaceae bacterium]|nr:hypothetical protein [Frankiaceae bacterium]
MPRPALAAALAAAAGLRFVVVGSAALQLHGADMRPRDLDIVPDPSDVDRFDEVMDAWTVVRRPPRRAFDGDIVTVDSAYGPIDLLLRRGREAYADLRASATMVDVEGVAVAIAAAADCWALRRRFKGET